LSLVLILKYRLTKLSPSFWITMYLFFMPETTKVHKLNTFHNDSVQTVCESEITKKTQYVWSFEVMNDLLIFIWQDSNLQRSEPTSKLRNAYISCRILYDDVARVFTYMWKELNYTYDNHIHMSIVYKRFEQLTMEWNDANKEEIHQ
jgi:hypothetical protein